tara:strand:+ start:68 stop:709 length:642 start_codon:yes stop_codon:yes gene_type:complete
MKKLLIITLLIGLVYSLDCEDWNIEYGTEYNCDCTIDTWQDYYPILERCFIPYIDLSNTNHLYTNFFQANLYGANLYGATFLSVNNLTATDLRYANLAESRLGGASLQYADLSGANLYNAELPNSYDPYNLQNAYLEGACAEGTIGFSEEINYYGFPIFSGCSGCNESLYEDLNQDGFDDVSYEAGATSGDVNLDGGNNILDIVTLVNIILDN